jgi:hypothetical protein
MSRVLNFIGFVAGLAVLGYAGMVHLTNRHLQDRLRLVGAAFEKPYCIVGFQPAIEEQTDVVYQSDRARTAGPILLLVGSRYCGYCAKQIPLWEKLLDTPGWNSDAAVWMVTVDSEDVFGSLRRRLRPTGRSYRVLKPVSIGAFNAGTGTLAVPTTLLLDKERRVELVYTGVFDDDVYAVFSRHLTEPRRGSGATFLRAAPDQTLLISLARASKP